MIFFQSIVLGAHGPYGVPALRHAEDPPNFDQGLLRSLQRMEVHPAPEVQLMCVPVERLHAQEEK